MDSYSIMVFSRDGTLKKSFVLTNSKTYESTIQELIQSGATVSQKSETSAKLVS